MRVNRLNALRLVILVGCLLNLVSFYRMTSKPQYTTCRLTTDAGATVHPRIEGHHYGVPIQEDYLILGPEGKYIGVDNVRENILITGIILLAAIILSLILDWSPLLLENGRTRRRTLRAASGATGER